MNDASAAIRKMIDEERHFILRHESMIADANETIAKLELALRSVELNSHPAQTAESAQVIQ